MELTAVIHASEHFQICSEDLESGIKVGRKEKLSLAYTNSLTQKTHNNYSGILADVFKHDLTHLCSRDFYQGGVLQSLN